MKDKTCVVCGKVFTPKQARQITCSDACSHERKKQVAKDNGYWKEKKCAYCGRNFKGSNGQKYCSDVCRKTALRIYNTAKKAEYYDKKRVHKKEEPTVYNTCPKDCIYRGKLGGVVSCDYGLITGTPRGGDVTTCTVYKKGKKKTRKWESMPVPGWY